MMILSQVFDVVKTKLYNTQVSVWDCAFFCILPILFLIAATGLPNLSLAGLIGSAFSLAGLYVLVFLFAGIFYMSFKNMFQYKQNVLFHGVVFFIYAAVFLYGVVFNLYLNKEPAGFMVNLAFMIWIMFFYFTAINVLNTVQDKSEVKALLSGKFSALSPAFKKKAAVIAASVAALIFTDISLYFSMIESGIASTDLFELAGTFIVITFFLYAANRLILKRKVTSRTIAYIPVSFFMLILNFIVLLKIGIRTGILAVIPSPATFFADVAPFMTTDWVPFLALGLTDVIFYMIWIWMIIKVCTFIRNGVPSLFAAVQPGTAVTKESWFEQSVFNGMFKTKAVRVAGILMVLMMAEMMYFS
ncbi:hypothetical protein MsAg5_16500 [Methanosarcinaceae archaeon Ag5]|uniref:Uncharacterized protein n=1 Tax=Methanolapillus africanus TaxID=3028297 RepID=A0AAE4MME4_9EURY|nr:hypothetical protein [Methanosarcinaceae archaeon Ag5]